METTRRVTVECPYVPCEDKKYLFVVVLKGGPQSLKNLLENGSFTRAGGVHEYRF